MKTFPFVLFFLMLLNQTQAAKLPLIPYPVHVENGRGHFEISPSTCIVLPHEDWELAVKSFKDQVQNVSGIKLMIQDGKNRKADKANVILCKMNPKLPAEAYRLNVKSQKIEIESSGQEGLFYALQTIRQLLPVEIEKGVQGNSLQVKLIVPCVKIEDEPRFPYRGMHLDVARHFFSVEYVKKYIDRMALYKFNKFHWHLTEDQGWRIEIKKYPELAKVSAWRNGTVIDMKKNEFAYDNVRYGGYYTQDEVREIVEYARERFITVIPEIEMPGHSLAVLTAFPKLSCSGGPFEVGRKWGVYNDVYCTREENFKFLEDVLTEVLDLFPSEYIHIGGDECPKIRWQRCAACQKRMQDEHLKDEHELQSYFIARMEKFLNNKGRQIIGWDEILEGGLAPNATVMSWRGEEGGIESARQHHQTIMTPGNYMYFDHYQADPKIVPQPQAIGGLTPLSEVYSYDPVPAVLSPEERKYIIGAQANVWTEYIKTESQVEYMIFPRMLALAEVVWSPKSTQNSESVKSGVEPKMEAQENKVQDPETDPAFLDFKARWEAQKPRLELMGIHYFKPDK